MHRNVYVNAPSVLDDRLRIRDSGNIFLAGQITGVEGYMESTAMGLVAALNLFALYLEQDFPVWPRETAIGSLLNYLSDAEVKTFRPMNVNLGILPRLPEKIRDKRERCRRVASVARRAMSEFSGSRPDIFSV
jgi:methylenetetrahydrofolate--tRNA-(uracil-5-)-methyltransferase